MNPPYKGETITTDEFGTIFNARHAIKTLNQCQREWGRTRAKYCNAGG
jgi:hypothetical protein